MMTSHPPYLVQQYRTWIVRMVIPADVRHLFPDAHGKPKHVIKRSTGESDIYRAQTVAAPIIAGIKREIEKARLTLRPPIQDRADALLTEYRTLSGKEADRMEMREFALLAIRKLGKPTEDYVQGTVAGLPAPDVEKTVKLLTGKLTPFATHIEAWAKAAVVAPKTRDEYRSAIVEFLRVVDEPLETLTTAQVQVWVDEMLADEDGLDAKTVNKKLSGLHNYWVWIGRRGYVNDFRTRQPFRGLDVRNPHGRIKVTPERYEPTDVVRLWQAAEGDLAEVIRIAAYTGARRESIVRVRLADIKTDPTTNVRFMHMTGKTLAGDRYVPIHSAIADLIDRRIGAAGADGYLFRSADGNQYGIRATGIGKQFAALKTRMGFGAAHDFHSIRRTAIHLFESAYVPEGVTQDIVGHKKLSITYGLYSGKTRIDQRAEAMEKALVYPNGPNGQSSATVTS